MKKTKDVEIAIVSSSFRSEVSDALEAHCVNTLIKKGVKHERIDIFRVPGSFEIPLVAKRLAQSRKYHAIITFGAVVKGKTYHFEQLSNELSRALMDIMLTYEIPIIFEVWSVYNLKDALERATRKRENKGVEAALTALKMIDIVSSL